MRLVLDTNILVSALLATGSLPAHLLLLWRQRRFDVLTSAEQIDELRRVTRYPKLRARLKPAMAGQLVNALRGGAITITDLPTVTASPDPDDNHLLALAQAGAADVLVTGDKRDLLALRRHAGTRILGVRAFLAEQRWLPS